MNSSLPNILVTNDDGIDSPGIRCLAQKLKELGNVAVVAPDRQQSAVGHSLTVSNPLRVTNFRNNGEFFGYAVNGTPSDCVKLGVSTLLPRKPDLIVSGINHGQNTSVNILYSGTVAAAAEGMLIDIPSVAFSIDSHSYGTDCSVAADYALRITRRLFEIDFPKRIFINVNIPALNKVQIKGIRIAEVSGNIWKDKYECRKDPFGKDYYWFSGDFLEIDKNPGSDFVLLQDGYVTITPVKYDLSDRKFMEEIKFFEIF